MPDVHHHLPAICEEMATPPTTLTAGASNGDGPSTGGSIASSSAPGVAEEQLRHEGVQEQGQVGAGSPLTVPTDGDKHRTPYRRANLDTQRSKYVTVRFAPHEKHSIQAAAKAEHVRMARYIADATMARVNGDIAVAAPRTVYDDAIDELAALRAQIARIGNNVNQIARRLNTDGDPHPVDAAILLRAESLIATSYDTVRAIDDAAFRAAEQKAAG